MKRASMLATPEKGVVWRRSFRILGRRVEGVLSGPAQDALDGLTALAPELVHDTAGSIYLGHRIAHNGGDRVGVATIAAAQQALSASLPPVLANDPGLLGFAVTTIETDVGVNTPMLHVVAGDLDD